MGGHNEGTTKTRKARMKREDASKERGNTFDSIFVNIEGSDGRRALKQVGHCLRSVLAEVVGCEDEVGKSWVVVEGSCE